MDRSRRAPPARHATSTPSTTSGSARPDDLRTRPGIITAPVLTPAIRASISSPGQFGTHERDEFEQVGVDDVGVRGKHAVRIPAYVFRMPLASSSADSGPESARRSPGSSSPCITSSTGSWSAQVRGEVRLRERHDAVIVRLRTAHHALPPPVGDDALVRLGPRAVASRRTDPRVFLR